MTGLNRVTATFLVWKKETEKSGVYRGVVERMNAVGWSGRKGLAKGSERGRRRLRKVEFIVEWPKG